jgi:hypothetical protein
MFIYILRKLRQFIYPRQYRIVFLLEKPTSPYNYLSKYTTPHSKDPRMDDVCPICLEHLIDERGIIAPICVVNDYVHLEIIPEPLSKCNSCGIILHQHCLFKLVECPMCQK